VSTRWRAPRVPFVRCRCGKRGYRSRELAEQVLLTARIQRTLRDDDDRRQERRTYWCEIGKLWHVTSREDYHHQGGEG
jgi:hypothetical protein